MRESLPLPAPADRPSVLASCVVPYPLAPRGAALWAFRGVVSFQCQALCGGDME